MTKKIQPKKGQKEFIAPILTKLLVPKRKQHQCTISDCKEEKFSSFQCAFGSQCLMQIDTKLHQSVPFFSKWSSCDDVVCAFCTRTYINPLFLAASDAYYYLNSLEPHMDFYVNLLVPAVGQKIRCCNKECNVGEGEFFVQSLSCLTPALSLHAFCMGCTPDCFNNSMVCDSCKFDLSSQSNGFQKLLLL